MWNFLKGMLLVRATGTASIVRLIVLLVLIGSVLAGVIYAFAIFKAVQQRSSDHHVQHHSSR